MISVVMPAYNRENIIKEAIDSVLGQTYEDIELIVVDDGSTDKTSKVVREIEDPRLKYFYQENAGACAARNKGVELSQGELVAFHDSDDIWHQDKLEKQIKAMETSGADLVFCKLVKYCTNGKTQLLPDSISEGFLNPVENLFGIGTQSLLAKKEVFEKCPFDISMPRFQEFEMLVRIAEKYRIYCLDDGLVDYKIGNDSISSNPEKLYKACDLILQKHPTFQKKYPKMMHIMASALQDAGNELKKSGKNNYKKFYDRSLEYDSSLKRKISIYIKGII